MGYRVGSLLPPDIQSIYIETFKNSTQEPLLESMVNEAILNEVQRDGTLRLTNKGEADAYLTGNLIYVKLDPILYSKNNPHLVKEYRLSIGCEITLFRTRDNSILIKRKLEGNSTFSHEGDISIKKHAAIHQAGIHLAHNILETIIEYW